MKIYKKIVIGLEILLGIFFLMNSASDIQLGFGLVLICMGLSDVWKRST